MKKKGFTLIELIAAVAIFSITIVSISTAFSLSISTKRINQSKIDTMYKVQTIAETFKSAGVSKLTGKLQGVQSGSCFVYFNDDMNDFNSWYNTGNISGNVDINNYDKNSSKKYCAYIKIEKDSSISTIDAYHLDVTVIEIKEGLRTKSVRDIYEGR